MSYRETYIHACISSTVSDHIPRGIRASDKQYLGTPPTTGKFHLGPSTPTTGKVLLEAPPTHPPHKSPEVNSISGTSAVIVRH